MQRFAAANEAQSGWTTPTTKKNVVWGGRTAFLEQNLEKRGKPRILLFHYKDQEKTSSIHFQVILIYIVFWYSFFRQLESHNE